MSSAPVGFCWALAGAARSGALASASRATRLVFICPPEHRVSTPGACRPATGRDSNGPSAAAPVACVRQVVVIGAQTFGVGPHPHRAGFEGASHIVPSPLVGEGQGEGWRRSTEQEACLV